MRLWLLLRPNAFRNAHPLCVASILRYMLSKAVSHCGAAPAHRPYLAHDIYSLFLLMSALRRYGCCALDLISNAGQLDKIRQVPMASQMSRL